MEVFINNILMILTISLASFMPFFLLTIAPEEARGSLIFFKYLSILSCGAMSLTLLLTKHYVNAIIFFIVAVLLSFLIFKKALYKMVLLLLSSYMILTAVTLKNEWLSASVFLFIISIELIMLFDKFKRHFSNRTKLLKKKVKLLMLRRTTIDFVALFVFTLILLVIRAMFLNQ